MALLTAQDRDIIFCAALSGTALLVSASGMGWAVLGLWNMIPRKNGERA